MRALGAAVLAAAACAAAAQAPEPPRRAKLDEIRSVLDYGLWNGRIDALYDLGDMGRDGLDLLAYADDDADWQVRLTAVHFLGKLGLPAVPLLGEVARREPCLHVRLFALEWLATMGATGKRYYEEAITPEDEAELARSPYHANPGFMGKPLAIDPPDEMNADFFNGGADLRVCASSERAGRLHRRLDPRRDEDADAASREVVATADVPPWAIAGSSAAAGGRAGRPEFMPPGPAVPERAEAARAAAETPEQKRRDEELDRLLAPGRPETLPPGPPAPEARAPEPPVAAFVADAGTGKPERDPIPGLIERLSDADPHRRARAADELGKRGLAAARAVPALRRALSDRDRRVRASAVLALGSAGAGVKSVAADLRLALRDKDEDVRFSAGIALERFKRLSAPR